MQWLRHSHSRSVGLTALGGACLVLPLAASLDAPGTVRMTIRGLSVCAGIGSGCVIPAALASEGVGRTGAPPRIAVLPAALSAADLLGACAGVGAPIMVIPT